ncbi:MAG: hypothetical protein ABI550_05250, partial [Ignavibacteriaceae bacterium]
MKKGCFIKVIIILTIVVAAIVYLIQNKFSDFIFKPGKKIISGMIFNDWENKLKNVKSSSEKDSLKKMFKSFVDKIETPDHLDDPSFEKMIDSFQHSFDDSVISEEELKNISEQIKNYNF